MGKEEVLKMILNFCVHILMEENRKQLHHNIFIAPFFGARPIPVLAIQTVLYWE